MITLKAFLSGVQENVNRIHAYELGQDGRNGTCDCIGLIIGAVRLAGGSWPGNHGSNWAARNAMETFGYIDAVSQCFPGMIVYKAREPGEAGYDLPGQYKSGGDLRDYCHVGVVTSVNPLCITHCTSVDGGIQRDNKLGKWRFGGKLKYVEYDQEEEPMGALYQARVAADNGYPVKMRKLPSTQSAVIVQVPLGAVVDVMSEADDTWAAIQYQGGDGYMMRKFLEPVGKDAGAAFPVTLTAEEYNTILTTLEKAVEILKNAKEEYNA